MSGNCRCVHFSPEQDFPIDAPCPPLSMSYDRFYEHALSQELERADILKIAEQCNLKAIEIITQGPETKDDTILQIVLSVVLVVIILVVVAVICWICCRRTTNWSPGTELQQRK